ncbi:metallophosphoesterase [Thermopolyspora sp. NPDC052614]|uniref:metallophosphoesterase n=1 Tax=Thermopolyspora sp. NPDC052614 TaxID=3155682 RepID=UPI00343D87A4
MPAAWGDKDLILYGTVGTEVELYDVRRNQALMPVSLSAPVRTLLPGPRPGEIVGLLEWDIVLINAQNAISISSIGMPTAAPLRHLAVSHPVRALIAIDAEGQVATWTPDDDWVLGVRSPVEQVTAACRLSSGPLVLGSALGEIVIADHGGTRSDHSLRAHGDQVTDLAVTDDDRFISISRDGTVAMWEILGRGVREIWRQSLRGRHFLNRISLYKDQIAIGTAAGVIALLDIRRGELRLEANVHSDSIRTLAHSPDGRNLVSSGDEGALIVTACEDLQEVGRLRGETPYIRAAGLVEDGDGALLAYGGTDGRIHLLSLRDNSSVEGASGPPVRALHPTLDGYLVVGREDGTVQELTLPELAERWSLRADEAIYSLATSPAGESVYAGTRSGFLLRISRRGELLSQEHLHRSIVGDIQNSPPYIITCSDDRSLKVTHGTTNTLVTQFVHNGLALNNIVVLSNGNIFTSSDDGSVVALTHAAGTKAVYHHHNAPVRAITQLRDRMIVSGDRSGEVVFWRPDDNAPVLRLPLGNRVIHLQPAGPVADIVAVTENEVSLIDIGADRLPDGGIRRSGSEAGAAVARSGMSAREKRAMTHILHLSDLHFHGGEDAVSWVTPLVADLNEIDVFELGAIVVSGDIASTAAAQEYAAAGEFFEFLRAEFNHPAIIMAPGNHDLDWAVSRSAYQPKRRRDVAGLLSGVRVIDANQDYVEVADAAIFTTRFDAFARFCSSVTGETYPLEVREQVSELLLPNGRIAMYSLNSSWDIDHHYTARASINEGGLARLLSRARDLPDSPLWFKIVVWHHPPTASSEVCIANAEVLEQLSKAGFRILLHGHVHRPMRSVYEYDASGDRGLTVVGAGAFGALPREWAPGVPLGYNIMSVHPDKVVVRSRKREAIGGAWMPDARWLIGPNRDPVSWFSISR